MVITPQNFRLALKLSRIFFIILFALFLPVDSFGIAEGIDMIDFEVLETEIIPVMYWVDEPLDFSDIIKVKFRITNHGIENFIIYKDMFQIDLEDPTIVYRDFTRPPNDFGIETFYPQYSEDFKLRFQDFSLEKYYDDCVLLNHSLKINQTRDLVVCFDVKKKWMMQSVDLEGDLDYYLVMMDNKRKASCPNCEKIKLNSESFTKSLTSAKKDMIKSLTPLKQIQQGKTPNEITCKEDYILMLRGDKAACITKQSAEKLALRGWEFIMPL